MRARAKGPQLSFNFLKGYLYAFIISFEKDPGTLANLCNVDRGKFNILNKHIFHWVSREMPKFSKVKLRKHVYNLLSEIVK